MKKHQASRTNNPNHKPSLHGTNKLVTKGDGWLKNKECNITQ